MKASVTWLCSIRATPRWGMKAAVWQGYTDFMLENGLLTAEVDIDRAFSNAYLPAAP